MGAVACLAWPDRGGGRGRRDRAAIPRPWGGADDGSLESRWARRGVWQQRRHGAPEAGRARAGATTAAGVEPEAVGEQQRGGSCSPAALLRDPDGVLLG